MGIKENIRKAVILIIEEEEHGNASAFARRIDSTPQTVCNWKNGRNVPDVETIAVIAKIYNKTLEWMILEEH